MTDRPRILIVEDDAGVRAGLGALLDREGYSSSAAATGTAALTLLTRDGPPDLVLLDLMLPDLDGIDVLRQLRSTHPETPVLVVSARAGIRDKVDLLDAGADDYLVKPFASDELCARIRALLKRFRQTETLLVQLGTVTVDLDRGVVTRDDQPLALTRIQFEILATLLRRPGAVVSRKMILDRVWGLDTPETPRVVDYHVLQIRRKIEPDPRVPRYLQTVPGRGYRMEIESSGP